MFQFDSKSAGLFKRLQDNKMLSFYVAADARGDKIGMLCGKARNIKQDSTRAKGKALRKELGANKFCRGVIVKEGDGTVKIVNIGGNIGDGLLKKLLKRLAEEAGGDQKSKLKQAAENIVDQSYLETLKSSSTMELDSGADGDDSSDSAPTSFLDALSAFEEEFLNPSDILREEMEITAEARVAYRAAQQTGENLAEAGAKLAGTLDTGSDIFDNAGGSALLASVFDTLISEKLVDVDNSFLQQEFDDLTRVPIVGGREATLRFLGISYPIFIVKSFDHEKDGRPAFLGPDGYLHSEYNKLDIAAWAEKLIDGAQTRCDNTLAAYEGNLKLKPPEEAAQILAETMAAHRDWMKDDILATVKIDLYPLMAISESEHKKILPLCVQVLKLYDRLVAETISAEQLEFEPIFVEEVEPEDAWSANDLEFLSIMHEIQTDHVRVLIGKSDGSFKFQLGPSGFPDLLRYHGWPKPRSLFTQSFSEVLQEKGYSDKCTGKFIFHDKKMMFSLDTENTTIIARIRGVLSLYGGKAHYIGTDMKAFEKAVTRSLLPPLKGREKETEEIQARAAEFKAREEELLMADFGSYSTQATELNEADGKDRNDITRTTNTIELMLHQTDQFYAFIKGEFSSENFLFVVATHPKLARLRGSFSELSGMMGLSGIDRILWLYDTFISSSAQLEINVGYGARLKVINRVEAHRAFVEAQLDPVAASLLEAPPVSELTGNVVTEYGRCLKSIIAVMQDSKGRFLTAYTE
ncbi:MAG: hypothetical protein ACI8RZ_003026 [Myxococcota bacterium]|jgi:hypothetical protein